jgi:predicted MFS family arabinose efflux permease
MQILLWCMGMALAIAIGAALGGSFVAERGRKVLPIVIALTIVTGVVIGWGLNGEFEAIQATHQPP